MKTQKQASEKIENLKNGEHCYFNTFQDGGAVCYRCNDMYLLFEVPNYGGDERYVGTYFENQLNDMIGKAFSWT